MKLKFDLDRERMVVRRATPFAAFVGGTVEHVEVVFRCMHPRHLLN